jgi:hypothetical protein
MRHVVLYVNVCVVFFSFASTCPIACPKISLEKIKKYENGCLARIEDLAFALGLPKFVQSTLSQITPTWLSSMVTSHPPTAFELEMFPMFRHLKNRKSLGDRFKQWMTTGVSQKVMTEINGLLKKGIRSGCSTSDEFNKNVLHPHTEQRFFSSKGSQSIDELNKNLEKIALEQYEKYEDEIFFRFLCDEIYRVEVLPILSR